MIHHISNHFYCPGSFRPNCYPSAGLYIVCRILRIQTSLLGFNLGVQLMSSGKYGQQIRRAQVDLSSTGPDTLGSD